MSNPGRNRALRQAGLMTTAQGVGLMLGAAGSVWVARCLGPHNLGISGMVQNCVMVASLFLGAIQPPLLVREYKETDDPAAKNRLLQSSTTFRFMAAGVFCALWTGLMAFHLLPDEYAFAGWFFIPLLLFGGTPPTWIFQALERQGTLSVISAAQYALASGFYFWLLRPGMGAGFDLAVLSAISFGLLPVYLFAIYRLTGLRRNLLDFKSLREVFRLTQKSKWLFFSALTTYACATLEQPLLGWLHSLEELGQYRTAVAVSLVAQTFFSILLDVLYPRFLEWRKRGEEVLWSRQLKLILLCAVAGSAGIAASLAFIPSIHLLIFGEKFARASTPCAILLASKFIVLPTGILLFGLMSDHRHDRTIFKCTFLAAVLTTILNILFIPKFGAYASALISLIIQVALFLMYFAIGARRMRMVRATPG